MKIVEFPKENSGQEDVKQMLTDTVDIVDEEKVTQAIVVMMTDEGNVGLSISGNEFDIHGMLALALKKI